MHIQLTKDRPISCGVSSAVIQSLLARSLLTITGAELLSSHCRNVNLDKLNPSGDRMRKEKGQANKRCDGKNESGVFRSEFVCEADIVQSSFLLHFLILACITFQSRIVFIYYYCP